MGDPEPSTGLVRRFTGQLEPASDLAIQTKQYQEDIDTEEEARDKARTDRLSNTPQIAAASSFSGVEIARQALHTKCQEFFATLDQKETSERKRPSALRFMHRESAEQKLARELRSGGELTIDQVTSIAMQLETQWKESHGKARTNFQKICQQLDDHKAIFQWFPSENSYTSVLCGAVTMVIQASVNYASIAEQLSGYFAEISDIIGVCTQWLDLYDRPSMQVRLSDIYRQFFDFFIQVASWYLKPKASRWLDSFNTSFSAGHKAAVQVIKNSVQLIREEAQIETALEVKGIVPHVDQSLAGVEERIVAQVLQARRENNEVGRAMHDLLLESAKEAIREVMHSVGRLRHEMKEEMDAFKQDLHSTGKVLEIEATAMIEMSPGLSRAEAETLCLHLQSMVDEGGSDGIRLAIREKQLVAEPRKVQALGKWTQATSGNAQILWIMCPWEAGIETSARAAALGVISMAIQTRAQFISFVCQRPKGSGGVLAMVYSLIRQLLQFQLPDDTLHIPTAMLDALDNWNVAMDMLKLLLDSTPTLRYCIVSGVNLLEGSTRDQAQEVVDLLVSHAQTAEWPVRLLFTTAGQSRVLLRSVPKESTVRTDNTFYQMKGRILARNLKME